ncbi:cytochrome P450 [Umezawaea sp. Da 62-37]|uniref:cytochrome P450 n=1 Tax=Umezawaea sp. Da 62-37 TaxID=3075927 RepID=UPI0028F6D4AF|nr:cytochrome P450 [Umezawaea sp. Da 62-37]WNV83417.1 cytochrome P450 [Umezawaea sp. Da 62-37]
MTETITAALPTTRDNAFDPPAELGVLRGEAPLHRLRFPDGHVGWLVTNHELVREIMADRRFSSRSELHHSVITRADGQPVRRPAATPGLFIGMDAPDHTRYRKLLTGQFTVRRMNQLSARIEEIVLDHLKAMRANGTSADLVAAFALPIPSLVICELLGVPSDERHVFQEDTALALRLETTAEEAFAAFERIKDFIRDLVVRKRTTPGDDMLSGLIASGEHLDDEEITGMGVLLLVAGHETTANMLGLGTLALLANPDQLAALKADPSLIGNTVEELLRYLSIIQFGTTRTALEDVAIGGEVVKAGDTLSLSVAAANRDPERFDDPDRLDVRRPASGHMSFGHGVHQCLGQQLARIEMRIGYSALFAEFPDLRLAVPADEVPLRTDMAIYGVHALPVEWS